MTSKERCCKEGPGQWMCCFKGFKVPAKVSASGAGNRPTGTYRVLGRSLDRSLRLSLREKNSHHSIQTASKSLRYFLRK